MMNLNRSRDVALKNGGDSHVYVYVFIKFEFLLISFKIECSCAFAPPKMTQYIKNINSHVKKKAIQKIIAHDKTHTHQNTYEYCQTFI